MKISIIELTPREAPIAFDWVLRLLRELGEEGDDLGALAETHVLQEWQRAGDRFHVFVAKNDSGEIVGILTLAEAFAIYANGSYGIINEMYVDPQYRSSGIGAMLVDASKEFGKKKGWARIDVTAPESERWDRTRRFYEKEGFLFTGPKLKFLLK